MSAEHEVTELRCALTEACKLLEVAQCPEDCIDGCCPPDGHQCQFCCERQKLLDEHG